MEKLSGLKKILEKLKKEKINVTGIYKHWNPEEVKKYEPDLDIVPIGKLFGITAK